MGAMIVPLDDKRALWVEDCDNYQGVSISIKRRNETTPYTFSSRGSPLLTLTREQAEKLYLSLKHLTRNQFTPLEDELLASHRGAVNHMCRDNKRQRKMKL